MRSTPSHGVTDRPQTSVLVQTGDLEPLAFWHGLTIAIPLALGMWMMILLAIWSI